MRSATSIENTPRVVAVAIAFFGGLTLAGIASGAFERFDRGEIALLALFAMGYVVLTAVLDPGVRGMVGAGVRALAANGSIERDLRLDR